MNLSQYKEQNTKGIEGLSNQLCGMAVEMGFLIPLSHSNITCDSDSLVHLYLHPRACQQIKKVADSYRLIISTAYRTLAQQYILKRNLSWLKLLQ